MVEDDDFICHRDGFVAIFVDIRCGICVPSYWKIKLNRFIVSDENHQVVDRHARIDCERVEG